MRNLFIGMTAILLVACYQKPHKNEVPNRLKLPVNFAALPHQKALWYTTYNGVVGTLGRINLQGEEKGWIESSIRLVKNDSVIVQDGDKGLFLLTRMEEDSIALLEGPKAQLKAVYPLPFRSNPQWVARDGNQRVWVVTYELNDVFVLSPDLKHEVAKIDLSDLGRGEELDGKASLSKVLLLKNGKMLVIAQRLSRKSWEPKEPMGYAIIETSTFQVEQKGFLELSNPKEVMPTDVGIKLWGSGSLALEEEKNGQLMQLKQEQGLEEVSNISYPFSIIDIHLPPSLSQPAALIAWYKKAHKSCVQLEKEVLYCEEGDYVFSKVFRVGEGLVVSYSNDGNAQVWALSLNAPHDIHRTQWSAPIQSLSLGP